MQNGIEKILVVRFSSLGDVTLATPVLGALKDEFPQSSIFFLTKARYGDLLRNDPRISGLIEFDTKGRHKGLSGFASLISELRSHGFDLLIDLHANLRSLAVRRLVKSKIKLKYNKHWLSRFLLVHCKAVKAKAVGTVDSYLEILRKIGIDAGERRPLIFLTEEEVRFSENFLLERDVQRHDIIVGVHPGARWETKRWDADKFRQVCQALIDRCDYRILLFGDVGEEKLVEEVKEGLRDEKTAEAVGLPLGKVMSLIKRCDCLVTNDSGPVHMASALRVPVVVIFGPTHPKLGFAPLGSKGEVLCANVECSPCSLHGEKRCGKKSRFCMDLIQPDMVVEAVERLLTEKKSALKET